MSTTPNLELYQREVGSLFPAHLTNTWGQAINRDLGKLDAVIAEVCTPEQIEQIKAKIHPLEMLSG